MTEERLLQIAQEVYDQGTSSDRDGYTDEQWYLREVWDEGYDYDFEVEDLIRSIECDLLALDEEPARQELNRALETRKGQCMYRLAIERGKIDEDGNRLGGAG